MKKITTTFIGAVITGLLATACSSEHQDNEPVSTSISQDQSALQKTRIALAKKIEEESRGKQFLFYGDTNHGDIAIHDFVGSEENMAMLARAKIRHLCLEHSPTLQKYIDQYAKGEMSDYVFEQFLIRFYPTTNLMNTITEHDDPLFQEQKAKNTAKLIQNARKHGIEVHCVDMDPEVSKNRNVTYMDAYIKMLQAVEKMLNGTSVEGETYRDMGVLDNPLSSAALMEDMIESAFKTELTPEQRKAYIEAYEDYIIANENYRDNVQSDDLRIDKRLAYDSQVAQKIQSIAGNKRAAVFYGMAHIRTPESNITYYLGNNSCLTVCLLGGNRLFDLLGPPTEHNEWRCIDLENGVWTDTDGTRIDLSHSVQSANALDEANYEIK